MPCWVTLVHWPYPEFSYTQLENSSDRRVEKEERNPACGKLSLIHLLCTQVTNMLCSQREEVMAENSSRAQMRLRWDFMALPQLGMWAQRQRWSAQAVCNSQSPSLLFDLFPILPPLSFPYNCWHSFKNLINTFFLFLPCHSVYLEWLDSKFESTSWTVKCEPERVVRRGGVSFLNTSVGRDPPNNLIPL